MSLFSWLYTQVVSTVSRGKVMLSQSGPRNLVQVTMLSGETKDRVEHMLPYGRSALPVAGDAVLLTVGASRDQVLCICVDDPSRRIPSLAPGEFGDSDGNSSIIFRLGGLRLLSVKPLALQSDVSIDARAPEVKIGAVGSTEYVLMDKRALDLFNMHTHSIPTGNTGAPNQQLAVGTHTTTALQGS